jgi:hypothetical protein
MAETYNDWKEEVVARGLATGRDFSGRGEALVMLWNNHHSAEDAYLFLATEKYFTNNRELLRRTDRCGCFHCLRIFRPSRVRDWTWDYGAWDTALCPYCCIDSVVADNPEFPVTGATLRKLHELRFTTTPP